MDNEIDRVAGIDDLVLKIVFNEKDLMEEGYGQTTAFLANVIMGLRNGQTP